MEKKLPVYDALLNENEGDEIELISFVTEPAIMRDFVYFKNTTPLKQYFNEEQRMIVSPVMIPELLIYRYNESLGEYYVKFSANEIKKIQYQYTKDLNNNNTNLEHQFKMDGVVQLENWIKEFEVDKSSEYGFGDLPIGTWFAKYKIDNIDLWDKIKAGTIKGLSIEGYLSYQLENNTKHSTQISLKDTIKNFLKKQ